jgi:FkbM family methyltransferase
MNRTFDLLVWIGSFIGKPPGWERVVRFFASPEKCKGMSEYCMTREGFVFLARPGVPIGWHVGFFGTYEPELREIFRAVLSSGGVAMDVGANVGWHTLLMARLVGDAGRVLAAEANPSVRARLMAHLSVNRVLNVGVFPYAVSDSSGTVTFRAPASDDPGSGDGHVVTGANSDDVDVINVETRTLDEICLSAGVERLDLIKIDVEGYEWPVLKGAEKTVARFRPHIVFEYIDEYGARTGATTAGFNEFFEKHNYRLFAIGRGGAEAVHSQHWPKAANIWAVPFPDGNCQGKLP